MQLDFKKAKDVDKEIIYSMFCKLVEDYEDLKTVNFEKIKKWEKTKLDKFISEYDCIYLNEQKVGYIRIFKAEGKTEIDDFFILPKYRNQGIGTRALEYYISKIKTPIFLCVYKKNLSAIKLYKKVGFEIKEDLDNTRIIMQKDLELTKNQ